VSLAYRQVQTFITPGQPLSGNPAAVVIGRPENPQALAKALSVSALAIIDPLPEGEFALSWFSAHGEIKLCGHGTLAAGHVLLEAAPDLDLVRFQTRHHGLLTVSHAPHNTAELSLPALPAQPGYQIIEMASEAEIRAYIPQDLNPAIQTIITAPGKDTDMVSRVFVEDREDAATGSAHCLLGPHWAAILGKTSLTARQASPEGGYMLLRCTGSRVHLTGRCHTLATGQLNA